MTLDPRTPVLVGCGQVKQRAEDPLTAREPLLLMAEALERAADDAGTRDLLAAADSIRVTQGLWEYSNPAALLRERFGAHGAETALGQINGSTVQAMINDAAREIQAGRREIVLIAGAESEHSKRRAKRSGDSPQRTEQTGSKPDKIFGGDVMMVTTREMEIRLGRPVNCFSLFESALRHDLNESVEENRASTSELWERFNAVAVDNEFAWIREPLSADTIRTPSDNNRMTAFPYTKYMCANMVVDMGAGLIVCSVAAARRHGVSEDRFIYPHAGTDVKGSSTMSERLSLHEQPAIGIAGRHTLKMANADLEEVKHFDLYSCFPSAVRIAARDIGIPDGPDLTVTGGLTFGGGPFNSYVMHSTANMMNRLRADPTSLGMISSVGGCLTKFAFALYSARPPEASFRYADVTDEVMQLPLRTYTDEYEGHAEIECYAIEHHNGEPANAIAACRLPDGSRTWAVCDDADLLRALCHEEFCGRTTRVRAGAVLDPS